MTSFDVSRFLTEGKAYLRKRHADRWSQQWEQQWTDERVSDRQRSVAILQRKLQGYSDRYQCEVRSVRLDDITSALKAGKAVMVHLKDLYNGNVYSWPGLVYEYDQVRDAYRVYCPVFRPEVTRVVTGDRLMNLLYPDSGINKVGYP